MYENKIIHGDCLDVLKQIDSESIDCIITDVPYNISKKNNFKTMKDRKGRNGIDFGEWDNNNFDIFVMKKFERLLKKGGSMVVFCTPEQYVQLLQTLSLEIKDRLVWHKTNPFPRNVNRRYVSNLEFFYWFVKKGKWTYNKPQNIPYYSSLFTFPSESGGGFKRYHPTQKNLKLMELLVKIHTNTNDIILDPFSGSGTTCIAAYNLNRKYIGIEKEKEYYDIAMARINSYTTQTKLNL